MARSEILTLSIKLPQASYPIMIGTDLFLRSTPLFKSYIKGSQVLIVTNDTVAALYLEAVKSALSSSSYEVDVVILSDGEIYKNQKSLNQIYNRLITNKHHRDTTLIALGGGVIGDITGFAAATYHRGVSFLQIPTTLLAQVDAAIGGKTAINYKNLKNVIGCFYQPQAVFIDILTLKTLPARELRAGLAEVLKYALLVGGDYFNLVAKMTEQAAAASESFYAFLRPVIAGACEIKGKIVSQDEQEHGARALLNLGHTFAHALEAYTHFKCWLHGEAVAIGLYCAAVLSEILGYLDKKIVIQIDHLLQQVGLPNRIPKEMDLKKLMKLMSHDKKVLQNKLRFVLLREIGQCFVSAEVTPMQLLQALKQSKDS